jgi:CHAD domain-containing protein
MAYRLRQREAVADGIERIAHEQFDAALAELQRGDRTRGIHAARKRLKMLRALLRLVRSAVSNKTFKRHNQLLRDVGRLLSPIRDADVLAALVKSLQRDTGSPTRALQQIEQRVFLQRHAAQRALLEPAQLRAITARMEAARDSQDEWTSGLGADAVLHGLWDSYRRARRVFKTARTSREDDCWHEWRKRAKDFWYHMRLVERAWPTALGATVDRCDELGDQLGDDHDLAVLATRLDQLAPGASRSHDRRLVRHLIADRRQRLQREAREAGERLFSDAASDFDRRMRVCWKRWR